jgi:hypothetical protein
MRQFLILIFAATAAQAQKPVRQLAVEMKIDGAANELSRIESVVPLSNGNVIIFGDDVFRGKLFGRDGRLIREFGHRGPGPGEIGIAGFANAGSFGDTVWIDDIPNSRIALFSSDGEPIREIVTQHSAKWKSRKPEWAGLSSSLTPKRLLSGEIAFAVPAGALGTDRFARGQVQDPDDRTPLMRLTWDGSVVGSTVILPKPTRYFSIGDRSFAQSFAHIPKYDISPDGKRVVIATIGEGAKPVVELLQLTTLGDTLGSFRIPFTPDRITTATVDSAVQQLIRPIPPSALPPGMPPQPSLAGREGEIRDLLEVPNYFSPFTEVRLENDGTTWLRWHVPGTNLRWLVVSPHGDVLMQVEQPRGELKLIDHGIWVVVYDDNDVPSLVRLGIPPR